MKVLWAVISLAVFFSGDYVKGVVINNVDMTRWDPFNCNRARLGCFSAGICNPNGTCTCNIDPEGGYDCNLPSNPQSCTIPNTCNGKGTCYNLNGVDTCYCEPGYVGADCDRARGYVECSDGSMSIEIYPQRLGSVFRGRLTVQEVGSNTPLTNGACVVDVSESGWNSAANRFRSPYSTVDSDINPCRNGLHVTTTADGVEACYNIRLWYNPLVQTYVDEVFTMCCNENTNINDGQATVGSGNENDRGAKINGSIEIVSGTLVHTGSGNVVQTGDTLSVGDQISFVVDIVEASSRYSVVRVNKCTANPGNIALVTNRCRDPDALGLVTQLRQEGSAIYVDMRAWNPQGINQITIACDTEACVDEITCGAATQCPGDSSFNYGRRKRQANQTSADRETFTKTATYSITIPFSVKSCPAQEPCPVSADVNNVFIPVAVVFAVLLVLTFGISIFLCFRLRQSDRSATCDHPPAYTNHAMTKA
ncbi:EGF-like domain-containing protein 1 [Liolophura sinensis]|uniref:EGF-like domain-containing protein 1 n=1 Tax=Liolophura sinensis TaxID=3198878 RepID=UPI0031589479